MMATSALPPTITGRDGGDRRVPGRANARYAPSRMPIGASAPAAGCSRRSAGDAPHGGSRVGVRTERRARQPRRAQGPSPRRGEPDRSGRRRRTRADVRCRWGTAVTSATARTTARTMPTAAAGRVLTTAALPSWHDVGSERPECGGVVVVDALLGPQQQARGRSRRRARRRCRARATRWSRRAPAFPDAPRWLSSSTGNTRGASAPSGVIDASSSPSARAPDRGCVRLRKYSAPKSRNSWRCAS